MEKSTEELLTGLRCCSSGKRNCDECTYNFDILTGNVKTVDGCDLLEERAANLIEQLLNEINQLKGVSKNANKSLFSNRKKPRGNHF